MQIVSKKVAFGSAFHELFQTIIKIFNIQISKIYSSQYQPYDDSRFYKFYTVCPLLQSQPSAFSASGCAGWPS